MEHDIEETEGWVLSEAMLKRYARSVNELRKKQRKLALKTIEGEEEALLEAEASNLSLHKQMRAGRFDSKHKLKKAIANLALPEETPSLLRLRGK